ncbi:uncharacterized protein LODBEIA_P15000 [Lodderomyces beijingensis]|uniref:Uncharacterized protein n=1 Tax=Lodderomyces beijingensis TaxID=1775926 RepID=A0ABP0ZK73_9ASCO
MQFSSTNLVAAFAAIVQAAAIEDPVYVNDAVAKRDLDTLLGAVQNLQDGVDRILKKKKKRELSLGDKRDVGAVLGAVEGVVSGLKAKVDGILGL